MYVHFRLLVLNITATIVDANLIEDRDAIQSTTTSHFRSDKFGFRARYIAVRNRGEITLVLARDCPIWKKVTETDKIKTDLLYKRWKIII